MPAPENARCCICGAPLVPDEIALTCKLIDRGAKEFRCIPCLAEYFGCSTERLYEKIEEFRRRGCVMFAPVQSKP